MNEKKEYSSRFLLLLMGALMALLLLVMAIGSTRAHYELSVTAGQKFQYYSTDAKVYILSAEKTPSGAYVTDESGKIAAPSGWTPVEEATARERYVLNFLLANGQNKTQSAADTQEVVLTLFATEGVADPDKLGLTLTESGRNYLAVSTEVLPGSLWYDTYGPGWLYQFYTDAGEELSWTLLGGRFSAREMSLMISGSVEEVALLTLLASTSPEME